MVLPPLKGGSCTEKAATSRMANVEARENPPPNVVQLARAFTPLAGAQPVPFGSKGCRWPVGNEGADMVQCGCTPVGGGPYCVSHAKASMPAAQGKATANLDRRLGIAEMTGRAV
jgi:hypothetical protein